MSPRPNRQTFRGYAYIVGLIVFGLGSIGNAETMVRLARDEPAASSVTPDGGRAIAIAPGEYERLAAAGDAYIIGFPHPDGYGVDLELRAFTVTGGDTRFLRGHAAGDIPFEPPDVRMFRGRVAGQPESLAYVWLSRGRVGGFIKQPSHFDVAADTILFGPRSAVFLEPASREHIIVHAEASREVDGPYCGSDMLAIVSDDRAARGEDNALTGGEVMRARIAIDATVEYYNQFGNLDDASAYAMSLMGAVSAVYERDVQTQLAVPFLRIFTNEPDPYTSGTTSSSTLLADLRSEWTNNPVVSGEERTVTHLFTKVGGMGGIAYVDVLCNASYGYGVSSLHTSYTYPNPSYTWDVDVVSHELGHNFGSPHTHCFSPEIDQCYNAQSGCYNGPVNATLGTIMSYCHLLAPGKDLVFHQRVKDLIRAEVEAAGCIDPLLDPGAVEGTDPRSALYLTKVPGAGGEFSIDFSWGAPCNDASVPGQDFALYEGSLMGGFDSHASVTCSTGGAVAYTQASPSAEDRYFIVVANTSDAEGDYGGLAPAEPCKPQSVGACD